MSSTAHDRRLLQPLLSDREALLEAILAWKEGVALEVALRRQRLLEPGEGTVIDDATGVHVTPAATGPINRIFGERYRKVRPHAKGALGEVFVARDEELQRDVALKEIQTHHADNASSQERFVREARLTGQLEHPGIVPVYGLGSYPDGRPYYAMRFIEGEPLSGAIKKYHEMMGTEKPMALRQLLGRFVALCNAVGYAHSRGVIHRDIKPANVMLGAFGETLVVDWGLARASGNGSAPQEGQDDSPQAGGTVGVLGTPAYMPPEQAAGDQARIGGHSDIYALGATLYHLLTGRTPIAAGALGDMLRKVEEGDFPAPRQVNVGVSRSLEAVVLKAMAARAEDRYATAQELAAEVEAWLADEPVTAYREPVWDRMRRWGRKHRTLVTSAVGVLLVSVVGLIVGIGAVSAEQRKTAQERDRAIDAEAEAEENLAVAEGNLKLARQAVNDTFDLAKGHKLLQQPGMQEVRKLLLEKALPFYKRFRVLKGNDPKSRLELAEQFYRVGYITGEIGNKAESRAAFKQAEEIFRALVEEHPTASRYRSGLAGTLTDRGNALSDEGKRREALEAYTQSRDIGVKLVKDYPTVTLFQNALASTLTSMGNLLDNQGKRGEALVAYSQARDIQQKLVKDNPTVSEYRSYLASTLYNMGVLFQGEGKRNQALKAYCESRDINENLVKDYPTVSAYRRALASSLTSMGIVLQTQGKQTEALKAYTQARNIAAKLVKESPKVTLYRTTLATTLTSLGSLKDAEGKRGEALKAYMAARDIQEELVKENPSVSLFRRALATTLTNLGVLLDDEGDRGEALKAYARARDIGAKLAEENPTVTEHRSVLAMTLNNMGLLLKAQGKGGEALKAQLRAKVLREKLVKDNPKVTRYRSELASTLMALTSLRFQMKDLKEALAHLDLAVNHLEAALKIDPRSAVAADQLLRVLYNRAQTLRNLGRHSDAAADWGKFILVAPMQHRILGRVCRAQSLARAGQGEQAMKEAEALARVPKLTAAYFYELACVSSLCVSAASADRSRPLPSREHTAEECTRKTFAWLQAAHKGGYFKTKANREQLLKDPDLDALRNRDDFKAFLKTLTPP